MITDKNGFPLMGGSILLRKKLFDWTWQEFKTTSKYLHPDLLPINVFDPTNPEIFEPIKLCTAVSSLLHPIQLSKKRT